MSLPRPFRRRRSAEADVTEYLPPAAVPVDDPEPTLVSDPDPDLAPDPDPDAAIDRLWAREVVEPPSAKRWGWFRRHRPSPVATFAIAFLFLLAAVVAAGFAHFTANGVAPWLSVGYSGAAVLLTILAVATGRER